MMSTFSGLLFRIQKQSQGCERTLHAERWRIDSYALVTIKLERFLFLIPIVVLAVLNDIAFDLKL